MPIFHFSKIDGLAKSPQSCHCERSEAISHFVSA
jgi:hypothetical protein